MSGPRQFYKITLPAYQWTCIVIGRIRASVCSSIFDAQLKSKCKVNTRYLLMIWSVTFVIMSTAFFHFQSYSVLIKSGFLCIYCLFVTVVSEWRSTYFVFVFWFYLFKSPYHVFQYGFVCMSNYIIISVTICSILLLYCSWPDEQYSSKVLLMVINPLFVILTYLLICFIS